LDCMSKCDQDTPILGPRNHVLDRRGNLWDKAPIVKYRDCLRWAVQKRLNRSKCHLGCGVGEPKEPRVKWGPDPACEGAILRGKPHARRQSDVSCAKTAESIEMPFGCAWTLVGRRCYMGAHWRKLANTIEPFVCGGDATLCQITLTMQSYK